MAKKPVKKSTKGKRTAPARKPKRPKRVEPNNLFGKWFTDTRTPEQYLSALWKAQEDYLLRQENIERARRMTEADALAEAQRCHGKQGRVLHVPTMERPDIGGDHVRDAYFIGIEEDGKFASRASGVTWGHAVIKHEFVTNELPKLTNPLIEQDITPEMLVERGQQLPMTILLPQPVIAMLEVKAAAQHIRLRDLLTKIVIENLERY